MSGYSRQGNLSDARKPDSRIKNTNVEPRSGSIPKTKFATYGSLGSASNCQNDNSSLTDECGKPDLDVHLQEKSLLPSGMDHSKLTPKSCQTEEHGAKQLKSMSSSDYSSKDSRRFSTQSDSSYMHPITANSQQGRGSDMYTTPIKPSLIPEKGKQIGDISREKADNSRRSEDTYSSSPITPFDICPKKVNTVIKLKPSLHVKNREIRNQLKRMAEGQNIDILRPGMVLMKGYISSEEQVSIVKTCRDLGIGAGGFYEPGYRDGAKLHLKMMCLGKNWDPQSSQYSEMREIDNSKPPRIPDKFHDMVKKALQDSNAHIQKADAKANAGKLIPAMVPDICIVNFYTKGGKLGLHQDKDESTESIDRGLPVVSFSIGDSAEFLYGDDRDVDKAKKVVLESGDVLIFGGRSRRIFHGVTSVLPDTAPTSLLEVTDMRPGRLNLTFRQF